MPLFGQVIDECCFIYHPGPKYLVNASYNAFTKYKKATIVILETDSGWKEAYKNWSEGKNPTDSPEWKQGIYFGLSWKYSDFGGKG